ncbi:hypothetical protein [Pseudomonas sp. GZD-222]|uniref:hypothetical protein n=1 Tax=Pseudomonas sp. GZD-222 TaxID=3404805 RepID=UPI003BB5466D
MDRLFQRASAGMCAIATLLLLGWLLKYSAYGIDFTDESFYLTWISKPFLFSGSTTQFGFVYHPLYKLLGGDIAALRQANILITFGLAWALCHVFLNSLSPYQAGQRLLSLTLSAGLASAALLIFHTWLVTPSYNSLSLQALMIAAIGVLMADKKLYRSSALAWMLIGVGGWLAFMAKPSTAMALALAVLTWLLAVHRCALRPTLLAVVSALVPLLASAWLIDGSIATFVARLQKGIQLTEDMGGGYTLAEILRIDRFDLHGEPENILLAVTHAVAAVTGCLVAKERRWRYLGLSLLVVVFAFTASLALGQNHWVAHLGSFPGMSVFSVLLAALLFYLATGRLRTLASITPAQWVVAALFMVTPHIYAFGGNGNYWQFGGEAAIFWLLAGLTLWAPLIRQRGSWQPLLPAVLVIQAIAATVLHGGLEKPYRQPQPLRLNTSALSLGPDGATLMLSDGFAQYIAAAVQVARTAGLQPGTPMVDLSGQSPGIVFALGADSIGQAWFIGGYPGSLKRASTALAAVSCQTIAASWVVWEPDGPRSLPAETLVQQGVRFPEGYRLAGSWKTAEGAGGYTHAREQFLYVPVNIEESARACQARRAP